MTQETKIKTPNFKTWVKAHAKKNSPFGDLADDIARDKKFPGTRNYQKIIEHMYSSSACQAAMVTVNRAFVAYAMECFVDCSEAIIEVLNNEADERRSRRVKRELSLLHRREKNQ